MKKLHFYRRGIGFWKGPIKAHSIYDTSDVLLSICVTLYRAYPLPVHYIPLPAALPLVFCQRLPRERWIIDVMARERTDGTQRRTRRVIDRAFADGA
jgi:hypothetical protein